MTHLILEVETNTRKVLDNIDTETRQQRLWTDTRELKDLRAVRCTCSKNHFPLRTRGAGLVCLARDEVD